MFNVLMCFCAGCEVFRGNGSSRKKHPHLSLTFSSQPRLVISSQLLKDIFESVVSFKTIAALAL